MSSRRTPAEIYLENVAATESNLANNENSHKKKILESILFNKKKGSISQQLYNLFNLFRMNTDLMEFFNAPSVIINNLDEVFEKVKIDKFITYILNYKYQSGNRRDTFLHDTTNLLEWYKTKNSKFLKISEINDGLGPSMPEFKILLATIALDIIKILITNRFPDRKGPAGKSKNTKEPNGRHKYSYQIYRTELDENWQFYFKTLLILISELNINDESSNNYFSYTKIMEIYLTFVSYTSGIKIINFGTKSTSEEFMPKISSVRLGFYGMNKMTLKNPKDNITGDVPECADYILYLYNILQNTPFILYPTFVQLTQKTCLNTLSAPVVNFYVSYTRSESHGYFMPPCFHLEHDVIFHGTLTHFHLLTDIPKFCNTLDTYKALVLFPKIYDNTNKEIFKLIYNTILGPFFKYVNTLNDTDNDNKIIDILFSLFHERLEYIQIIYNYKLRDSRDFTLADFLNNIIKCKESYYKIEQFKQERSIDIDCNPIKPYTKSIEEEKTEIELIKKFIEEFENSESFEQFASSNGSKNLHLTELYSDLHNMPTANMGGGYLKNKKKHKTKTKTKTKTNRKNNSNKTKLK